jgi:4-carboxymuconolactone decarboxylase
MGDLTERGLELFSEMRGTERAAEMRDEIDAGGFGSAMVALAVDFVFGSIWTRPGLDRKQRSLVTMGILIALRRTEEFKNHVQIGLRNGLTVGEIEESLIHATAYAGFPAAYAASNAAAEVVRDLESAARLPNASIRRHHEGAGS